jgi:hypothetical protein
MHDVRNIVNEEHDIFLQDLSHISEVPDVAEPEDGHHLVALDQRVHSVTLF